MLILAPTLAPPDVGEPREDGPRPPSPPPRLAPPVNPPAAPETPPRTDDPRPPTAPRTVPRICACARLAVATNQMEETAKIVPRRNPIMTIISSHAVLTIQARTRGTRT